MAWQYTLQLQMASSLPSIESDQAWHRLSARDKSEEARRGAAVLLDRLEKRNDNIFYEGRAGSEGLLKGINQNVKQELTFPRPSEQAFLTKSDLEERFSRPLHLSDRSNVTSPVTPQEREYAEWLTRSSNISKEVTRLTLARNAVEAIILGEEEYEEEEVWSEDLTEGSGMDDPNSVTYQPSAERYALYSGRPLNRDAESGQIVVTREDYDALSAELESAHRTRLAEAHAIGWHPLLEHRL